MNSEQVKKTYKIRLYNHCNGCVIYTNALTNQRRMTKAIVVGEVTNLRTEVLDIQSKESAGHLE